MYAEELIKINCFNSKFKPWKWTKKTAPIMWNHLSELSLPLLLKSPNCRSGFNHLLVLDKSLVERLLWQSEIIESTLDSINPFIARRIAEKSQNILLLDIHAGRESEYRELTVKELLLLLKDYSERLDAAKATSVQRKSRISQITYRDLRRLEFQFNPNDGETWFGGADAANSCNYAQNRRLLFGDIAFSLYWTHWELS